MFKRIVMMVIAASLLLTGTAIAAGKEKENDVVFVDRDSRRGPDYIEVFKKEGTNGKNYLYTITQVKTPGGEYCTIITFASETSGTSTCRQRADVANPEVYRELKPELFPDRKPS